MSIIGEGNNLLLNPCLEAYVCIRRLTGRLWVLFYLKSTCIVAKKDKKWTFSPCVEP